jgi:hypothetical protein
MRSITASLTIGFACFLCVVSTDAQRARSAQPQAPPRREAVSPYHAFCSALRTSPPARDVNLQVEENYDSPGVRTNIRTVVERMLAATGLNLGQGHPLTLKIQLRGSSLSATYGGGVGPCYNGARVFGDFWVEGLPNASFRQSFSGLRQPPGAVVVRSLGPSVGEFCIPKKEHAPFAAVLYESEIFDHIAFFMRHHYGRDSELCYWSGALHIAEGSTPAGLPSRKAIKILGESRDLRVLDSLLRHKIFASGLEDAIAGFGPPAVDPLIKALNDESVRDRAARALGKIGDKRAIGPLIDLLPKSEPAQWALIKLTNQQFGNSQRRWRTWWNKQQAQPNRE